jgi:hypothetical protein
MDQKTIVYMGIKSVIKFKDGDKVDLKEKRKAIYDIVAKSLHEHRKVVLSTEASEKYDSVDKLRKQYVPGLVNNWLRKDTRLNGGTVYKIKNPGSRITDKMMKAYKVLREQFVAEDDTERLVILDKAIEARRMAIIIEKAKTVKIDLSVLPEELLNELDMEQSEESA